MAGILTVDGAQYIDDLLLGDATATDLKVGLFTNAGEYATLKSLALASVTEPTGGGYARIDIAKADASVNGTTKEISWVEKQFQRTTGGTWTGIRGAFIATTEATPRLIFIMIDPNNPTGFDIAEGHSYYVTPKIDPVIG